MMPGTYDFPFSYQLPDQLPGSFYERQALTDIPGGCEFEDKSAGIFSRLKGENENFDDSDDEEPSVRRKVLAVINVSAKRNICMYSVICASASGLLHLLVFFCWFVCVCVCAFSHVFWFTYFFVNFNSTN
jgi:uncharacterized membrane protein